MCENENVIKNFKILKCENAKKKLPIIMGGIFDYIFTFSHFHIFPHFTCKIGNCETIIEGDCAYESLNIICTNGINVSMVTGISVKGDLYNPCCSGVLG